MEIWDLYTKDGQPTGKQHRRGDPLPAGFYHPGVHVWIKNSQGQYLMSQRAADRPTFPLKWECVGGSMLAGEDSLTGAIREVREELGLRIPAENFRKLAVYGEPGRIAAYRDGSIWRMVIVVFGLDFPEMPEMRISSESKELRFFTKEQLRDIEIVITHSDIVEDWFLNR